MKTKQKPLLKKGDIIPFPTWKQAEKRRFKLPKQFPEWNSIRFAFGGFEFKDAKAEVLNDTYSKYHPVTINIIPQEKTIERRYTMLTAEMLSDSQMDLYKKSILNEIL
jgi:hypothetical protein